MQQRLEEVEVIKINKTIDYEEKNLIDKDYIAIYDFNETSDSETPANKLPWPRWKKQRTSNEPEKFSRGDNAIGNENVPHSAGSDLDHSCPSNTFEHSLRPKIEALVLRENVEVSIVPLVFGYIADFYVLQGCPGLALNNNIVVILFL